MRAFVVKELTHPSNISLSTGIPEPTAGPGQVLVDVYSAGLNFFEVGLVLLCPIPIQLNHAILDPPSTRKIPNKTPFAIYSRNRICRQDI
jgi:NADPH:quinone reductase-like Zn-dependent oxidoreductase